MIKYIIFIILAFIIGIITVILIKKFNKPDKHYFGEKYYNEDKTPIINFHGNNLSTRFTIGSVGFFLTFAFLASGILGIIKL